MNSYKKKAYQKFIQNNPRVEFEEQINNQELAELQDKDWLDFPVQVWCEQFEGIDYRGIIFVFGMGDPKYLKRLIELYPNNKIIVYEPNEKNIFPLFYFPEFEDVIENKNVFFVAGKKKRDLFDEICANFITYINVRLNYIAVIPNYRKQYQDEYLFFLKTLSIQINIELMTKNTLIKREEQWTICNLHNHRDMPYQYSFCDLKEEFLKHQIEDYPAILVSAGPSLKKNVMQLKKFRNKCFIICTNPAIRVLEEAGIQPNVLIALDDSALMEPFETKIARNTPMILSEMLNYKAVNIHKGKRFYITSNIFDIDCYERFGKKIQALTTGGSVATSAFSALLELGFKKIIMIGQDLAFDGMRQYADSKLGDNGRNLQADEEIFWVEGMYEEKVMTKTDYNIFRLWFEEQALSLKEIKVINATEGGARIHYVEEMKLEDALIENCPKNTFEFDDIIQKVPLAFGDKCDEVYAFFIELENQCYEMIPEFENNKKIYKKLEQLAEKKKYDTDEFKKCIKKIRTLNEKYQDDIRIELLDIFGRDDNYKIMEQLASKEMDAYQEFKLIAKTGKETMDAYIRAAELLKERKEIVEEFRGEN